MNIRAGIRNLTLLFVILFIALSAGLVYWQVVVAQDVAGNVHNGRPCLSGNAPKRGRILDRNGVVLAQSTTLGPCGYIRHYTDPSLAGLIGYYVSPLFPSTGIEHQFNDVLSGNSGIADLNNIVNKTLHRPPVGEDIYLTIDERIQQIANKHFDDPIPIDNHNTFQTNRGSVIITDPHTGEILAMVSRPGFDPNAVVKSILGDQAYFKQLVANPDQPLLERPISATYVPGSTYKTMTLLAGLDSGHTNLNQQFDQKQALGPIFFNGEQFGPTGNNISGYTFRFPVTTEYGFAHSDNIIFAQIGVNTGAATWLDYNKRLYVGQKIPFVGMQGWPVAVSSVQKEGQDLSVNGLAENSFGQGVDAVTPLQMSLIDNTIANDGQLMKPKLVLKVTDSNNQLVTPFNPENLGNPISNQTAIDARKAMYGVIRCGSGSIVTGLFNSPWSVIGKTGTGEVGGGKPAQAWMITQAPYSVTNTGQLPALTIVAMKENGGEGGSAVGPMIASMYQDIFSHNYVKVQAPPAPDTTYCCNNQLLQRGCPTI
jgi:cell division protein FtsI/penicillin-binding protein 2